MPRNIFERTYIAPLDPPLETQATIAPDPGEWRLIVFHGTPGNRYIYGRFLRTAHRGVEVVLPARPGFGPGHARAFPDFDDQVAVIEPFLPGGPYGDKKIVTLGVSYGGELALKAAMDYPDAIVGAVAVSALIDEPHDYALRLERIGSDGRLQDFIPDRWKRVREEIAGRRAQIGPLLERLKDYSGPVEIVHGDFDAIVPKANSEKLYDCLSEASRGAFDLIPGGTHYLEGQYPRRLHQAVGRVIERVLASEGALA
ncbi:MAG: alpha/beta fold hydrolase [Pseudomonadota bacterium]